MRGPRTSHAPARVSASQFGIALGGLTALAALLFSWQLGSSSLFVDEASSLKVAADPLPDAIDQMLHVEHNPPLYFVVLRGWLEILGSSADWAARVPSVVAAVALVAVTGLLGRRLFGPAAGLLAAALTALSPLVLGYAQQARPYALLALAATSAVLATVQAERSGSRRTLAAAAVLAATAVWLHYLSVLLIAPLALWVVVRSRLGLRLRLGFAAIVAVAWAASLPLAVEQYTTRAHGGLGAYGDFRAANAIRTVGAPFDARYASDASIGVLIGAALVVAAFLVIAWRHRRAPTRERELLLVVAASAPLVLLAASLAGREFLLSRYAAVAVPSMLVVLAGAIFSLPRVAGAAVAVLAVAVALFGTAQTHRPTIGFMPDTREAARHISEHWRPGDAVVSYASFGSSYTLRHYATRRFRRIGPVIAPSADDAARAVTGRQRLWLVHDGEGPPDAAPAIVPPGYELAAREHLTDGPGLTVLLAERTGR